MSLPNRIEKLIEHVHLAMKKQLFSLSQEFENLEEIIIQGIKFSVFSRNAKDLSLIPPLLYKKECISFYNNPQRIDMIFSPINILKAHHIILNALNGYSKIKKSNCFINDDILLSLQKMKDNYLIIASDYELCESLIVSKKNSFTACDGIIDNIYPIVGDFDSLFQSVADKEKFLKTNPEALEYFNEWRYQMLQFLYPGYSSAFIQVGGYPSYINKSFDNYFAQINHEMINSNSTYLCIEQEKIVLNVDCF